MLYWIPLLLAIEAFYSGSEIALLSADRVLLKQRAKAGEADAARVQAPPLPVALQVAPVAMPVSTSVLAHDRPRWGLGPRDSRVPPRAGTRPRATPGRAAGGGSARSDPPPGC